MRLSDVPLLGTILAKGPSSNEGSCPIGDMNFLVVYDGNNEILARYDDDMAPYLHENFVSMRSLDTILTCTPTY